MTSLHGDVDGYLSRHSRSGREGKDREERIGKERIGKERIGKGGGHVSLNRTMRT